MGRVWTDADQEQWQHIENHAGPTLSEHNVLGDLLLRDVATGCILHVAAVFLYWLRLAAPPSRCLGSEIKAATEGRKFWDWLGEPMLDLPEQVEASAATDR